jgi:hydroxymethylpyrimidine/phosphomethylpyrimidine kinase
MPDVCNALSIAGSDPSGGAGIQADLKTFSALGAYGAAALTALTAQNTRGVRAVHMPPADFVAAQIDALFADLRIDAVKIGMLGNAPVAERVADALERWNPPRVVLDPVLVAKSGDRLLEADATAVLRDRLLPKATVLTPNLPEAAALLDAQAPPADENEAQAACARLGALGPRAVLLKGGHGSGEQSPDWFWDGEAVHTLAQRRVQGPAAHGTGCTLSSAVAALLPRRETWLDAVCEAKTYVTEAIIASPALAVGGGHPPTHHFYAWWPEQPVAKGF